CEPPSLSCFFPLVLPRLSSLFPYTTLFRSVSFDLFNYPAYLVDVLAFRRRPASPLRAVDRPKFAGVGIGPFVPDRNASLVEPAQDRKSTRLNSSHVKISYAVFCLKKKRATR